MSVICVSYIDIMGEGLEWAGFGIVTIMSKDPYPCNERKTALLTLSL